MIYTYDIEVYPNLFTATFISTETPKEVIEKYKIADYTNDEITYYELQKVFTKTIVCTNDFSELIAFIKTCKVLVGYNSIKYDDIILEYIIKNPKTNCQKIKEISDELINSGFIWDFRKLHKLYNIATWKSIDLMSMHAFDKKFISLKQVAISLKYYRIQDLPIHQDKNVANHQIKDVIDYNINDTIITYELYWVSIEDVQLRFDMTKLYNVNLLSSSRAQIADRLFSHFYSLKTGLEYKDFKNGRTYRRIINLKDIVPPYIHFNEPILQNFLFNLLTDKITIGQTWPQKNIFVYNTKVNYGVGGLHTEDRGGVFNSTDNYYILDADVSSFYPLIRNNNRVCPAHIIEDVFHEICLYLTEERLKAKKIKYKTKANGLKIVINVGTYGKFGDEYSFLYDPKAKFTITHIGQLLILSLMETYAEIGGEILSANTDGVTIKLHKSKIDEYYRVSTEWQERFKMELEFVKYDLYVRRDINAYFAITDKGEIKTKGLFSGEADISKGYAHPVVGLICREYFIAKYSKNEKYDIIEHLKNYPNIYDFCMSQKTANKFDTLYYHIKGGVKQIDKLQKTNRYYVSKNGGALYKKDKSTSKIISIVAGKNITIFNDYIHYDNIKDYNIDYTYYLEKIYDIIDTVENNKTKLLPYNKLNLFSDEQETDNSMFEGVDDFT